MINKKIVSTALVFLLVSINLLFVQSTARAEGDTTAPVLQSISIDKASAVAGESVKVTVNATDNGGSGIKAVLVYYISPITKKQKLIFTHCTSEGVYEGSVTLAFYDEPGIWQVDHVELDDMANNTKNIYNSKVHPTIYTPTDMSNCNFELKGTTPDMTAPQLQNISIDKTSIVPGESVKVTVNATDNGGSGIKNVIIYYISPITKKQKLIFAHCTSEVTYEGSITLSSYDEYGTWQVDHVELDDMANNTINIYNSKVHPTIYNPPDMSNCNFELKETASDITAPQLQSISIDKNSMVAGDSVKVTVNATDNGGSGIRDVIVHYISPITEKEKLIFTHCTSEGVYEGSLTLSSYDESGTWKVCNVELYDMANNGSDIYNSKVHPTLSTSIDMSSCNFDLKDIDDLSIKPLSQKYVTNDESWSGNVIDNDLYIGRGSVLTINGPVTVNGNIYVLGAIKDYGNLTVTGTIYAKQFVTDESTIGDGTVLVLGNNNSIGSMVASKDPFDIPFNIYEANNNTLIAFDGKIRLTGAILPITDLYMDNNKVNYYSDGTFSLQLDTNNKQQVDFKTVTGFGNEKTISYKIVNKYYDTNGDNTINILDIANVSRCYNSRILDANWQDQYDYNSDGIVDLYDLVNISKKIN